MQRKYKKGREAAAPPPVPAAAYVIAGSETQPRWLIGGLIQRCRERTLAPFVVNACSQSLQVVKAGSTMSDVGKSGGRPKLFGLGRQLPKDRAPRTARSGGVGVILMYNPVESID